MKTFTTKKKIMIVGAGNLCLQILKILAPKNEFAFIVAGRNAESTLRLCNLVRLASVQLGAYISIESVAVDINKIDQMAQVLNDYKPDIVLNCASLQSWRIITTLPKLTFAELDKAQFGPWLPMHLTLMHRLMLAIKMSGIQTKTVNAAFPDAVNPILGKVGLAPDLGIGNVANLIPAIRLSIAGLSSCHPADVNVNLYAQHYFSHYVPRDGIPPSANYKMHYSICGSDASGTIPDELIFSSVKSDYRRLGGIDGQFLTASSAVTVIEGIFSDTPIKVHAPGPLGLPGGYPVILHGGSVHVLFTPDCDRDAAIKINNLCQRQDGIDEIDDDGRVTFNDECMSVMDKLLGYSKRTMSISQSGEFAQELGQKYSALKNSTW